MSKNKFVYFFGDSKNTDGNASMTKLLGGKGANLAEMSKLNIPVPPGFTISTEACIYYMKHKHLPEECDKQIISGLTKIELIMKQKFGSSTNPLLVSVRSGARKSMPGMMETVLNVGLTNKTIQGLIHQTNNKRFSYDAYRRLIMMYADVVMDKANTNKKKHLDMRAILENELSKYKNKNKINKDISLSGKDWEIISEVFLKTISKYTKQQFPNDSFIQLYASIEAVFKSWYGKRAVEYRKIEKIPDTWGTAVNVQAMVFGNMGNDSATGVAFSRNPATGDNYFFGEWLPNAQGEDVVAGIRTPYPINNHTINTNNSLNKLFPVIYKQLDVIQKQLEVHYKDMQDIEFTIQENKLWLLQTRTGKRNGRAAIKIALDLKNKKIIDEKTCLSRIHSNHINELLLPIINPQEEKNAHIIGTGLPAGPGSARGKIVFDADTAQKLHQNGEKVVLVREETSPEDVHGMFASQAILTTKGGMTSHAALVARGWGKCCVVGSSDIIINASQKHLISNNKKLKEYDWITLNGSLGRIYSGKLNLINNDIENNNTYNELMNLCIKSNKMNVRANADQKKDAMIAKKLGARGIGLCRTEHMFFNPQRIKHIRKMILSNSEKEQKKNINHLLPYQKNDFYSLLKVMAPFPVTIRLLDPPLHEFLPQNQIQIKELSEEMGITKKKLNDKISSLKELNPMLGHRGCRLGITFPEITIMQTKAIFLASIKLAKEKINVIPEIMIPLISSKEEFLDQKKIIIETANEIFIKSNIKIDYKIGTMIELPRACLIADQIAQHADFISFGTNDLTQTTFGLSRDDIGSFLPAYFEKNIFNKDPFASLDIDGVGELIKIAIKKSKKINPNIKIGICGEHGGDSQSISFFYKNNFSYVSCSPFRVPIAYLSVAKLN